MSIISWFRTLAGLTALYFLLLLVLFFGRFAASAWALPVPSLRFNLPIGASVSTPGSSQPAGSAHLVIDKLGIDVPIQPNISLTDQAAYDQALQKGVALASGSAPLESSIGNSFLFGHSSQIGFRPTPFDTVFAGIPRLQKGDTLAVVEAGQTTHYQVTLSQAIKADDTGYLASDSERKLTLVTCWPLGWNSDRWVVQATLVR
ncbi:sortase [Patescibacteria group bacterium]|nr:sortase [Patescibacteria group bacterium]